ncbi:MAG: alpha/beta hydrolase [Thermoactinospora sp.]|nr:alpha/beta hydrolase [Thermoactinospora sp.]
MISRLVLALSFLLSAPAAPPEIEWQGGCPVAVPSGTRCGFLVVPERRDKPEKTIKVGFARYSSPSIRRKSDPVVFTAGGPGAATLQLIGTLRQMFPDRDVIALEQRGSRYSRPSLGCPEAVTRIIEHLIPASGSGEPPADTCLGRLREEGVDLRGYTTEEIAADVVDLRQALGYPQWNLFGVSYSTRSMLRAAALDPEGTRTLVLDSFLPEGVAWYDDAERNILDVMAALGVRERFERLAARFDAKPLAVDAPDPLTGGRLALILSGGDLMTILGEAIRDAQVAAALPALIDALEHGRHEVLQPILDRAAPALASYDWGLYHAVQCQDEVPFNEFAAEPRLFTAQEDRRTCKEWKLPSSKPAAATTEAPVLVVSGALDPTTPSRTARPAAERLPGARFVEFPGVGHAVFLTTRCGQRTIAAFVADPAAPAAAPCPAPYERVEAGQVHLTAAPYRLMSEPWLAAPLALFALIAVLQLVAGGGHGWALTAFAGLSGLAFAGLTLQIVYGQLEENEVVLALGVPAAVWPVTWLAILSVLLSALSLRFRRRWPQITSAVVGAGFLIWWFIWAM